MDTNVYYKICFSIRTYTPDIYARSSFINRHEIFRDKEKALAFAQLVRDEETPVSKEVFDQIRMRPDPDTWYTIGRFDGLFEVVEVKIL